MLTWLHQKVLANNARAEGASSRLLRAWRQRGGHCYAFRLWIRWTWFWKFRQIKPML